MVELLRGLKLLYRHIYFRLDRSLRISTQWTADDKHHAFSARCDKYLTNVVCPTDDIHVGKRNLP